VTKRPEAPHPLVAAAEQLESVLAAYDRAAHALLRQKLDSRKNLSKAAELLHEVARAEQALSGEVGTLVAAIAQARDRQQAKSVEVQQRAAEVLARNEQLQPLIVAFQEIAEAVGRLGDAARDADQSVDALGPLLEQVAALGERARAFAQDATERGFEDLAVEGHTLREQLLSLQRNAQRKSRQNPQA
jgi:uncharacterized protein YoxC